MAKNKIGFFSLNETETSDSYVGALLITDEHGIPLEFKCTHAIKPTAIQKTLYGDQLKPYMAVELAGVPLLNSISNKPELLFITMPYIYGIQNKVETYTLLIRKAGESINLHADSIDSEHQRIENESGQYDAIVLQQPSSQKENKMDFNELVVQLFNNFDLMEPFERIKKAIEILGKNDSKFK